MRISTTTTVRRCDRPRRLPSFAANAAVTDVLAAGLIRGDLQAHLALARVGEQPSSSTPISLPVRTTRGSAPRFAGRQALHRHEAYRYVGGGEWTPVAQCARSERGDASAAHLLGSSSRAGRWRGQPSSGGGRHGIRSSVGLRWSAPIAATLSSFHQGRTPRNKGLRYPPDPPTVEEIIAVMRRPATGPTRSGSAA